MLTDDIIERAVAENVRAALLEDIGEGDVTADLIPGTAEVNAIILTRENLVVCGRPWVERVFSELDSNIKLTWNFDEGEHAKAGDTLLTLHGNARLLLTGERTALNFLQLLSGTASICHEYAQLVAHTEVKLLDTRKTIPGLRIAQKYAAKIGGCFNHRIGLFDAFLIKENHIAACGSIDAAVQAARRQKTNILVEVEVESFEQLEQAMHAGADRIMLDNFSVADMREAVGQAGGSIDLEASGNITRASIADYAETGVDYISIGALTKHCQAKDLSMRLEGTI